MKTVNKLKSDRLALYNKIDQSSNIEEISILNQKIEVIDQLFKKLDRVIELAPIYQQYTEYKMDETLKF